MEERNKPPHLISVAPKAQKVIRLLGVGVKIENSEIRYKVRKSGRAKRLRINVYRDQSVILTMPRGIDEGKAKSFIEEKSRWIISKLEYFRRFPASDFPARGGAGYAEHKNKALEFARRKVDHYNGFYNFAFSKISVRNQKARWGSCSRKGNLNFNYKIVLLPEKLADYIIVHELCHLKEFNHSRNFWDLVGRSAPDYRNIRKELRSRKLF